jgi:serine/threonine protein kinase
MVDWYLLGVLLYELVIGATPYFSNNKEQLFNNIKTMPLVLPNSLSKECKSLIKGLMNRNPSRRLGVDNDG